MASMHLSSSSVVSPVLFFTLLLLLLSQQQHLHILRPCHAGATAKTVLPAEGLAAGDTLLSSNGRFALGFFQSGNFSDSDSDSTPKWYLGIWFHTVPKLTPVWVANADHPVAAAHLAACKLVLSGDGDLRVILADQPPPPANNGSSTVIWSSNSKTNATTAGGGGGGAMAASLLDNGNLVVHGDGVSNDSDVVWQSFDHPTDTILQGAKIGWTADGVVRRLVSRKNAVDQSPGIYSFELSSSSSSGGGGGGDNGTTATAVAIVSTYNSSVQYWSSGSWGGRYFSDIPETVGQDWLSLSFAGDGRREATVEYAVADPTVLSRGVMDVAGQLKVLLWFEGSSTDWQAVYTAPKSRCDVFATCGAFAVCNDAGGGGACACMKGYSVRSPRDWDLGDRTGGCARNIPLHCGGDGAGAGGEPDKFYAMASVQLPADAQSVATATGAGEDECKAACLGICSCTAYSFVDDDNGGGGGCNIWHDELINVRQQGNSVLHLRLAAKELETGSHGGRRGVIIGAAVGATAATLGFIFLVMMMIWVMRRKKKYGDDDVLSGGIGIIAFRYADLQNATKNFSEKLGAGSFGSVFKGALSDTTAIAVKRLDGVRQGEKQFRAEVSSTGVVQHVNLVKLIGFCCEGDRRLLVYEYMPNGSLDSHLFFPSSNNGTVLDWSTRYQIALGVARGLAYLHSSCRDCIIHCDIKPENILLDGSFTPKVADFGMAKFLGRDFSHVVTTMRGTIGYLAPEWISGTAITSKVDVYSYGMVLLEIISGSRNATKQSSQDEDGVREAYFPVRVARGLANGNVASLVDANLLGEANMEEVERVCKVACWCIQDVEFDRPTMSEVVQFLECLSEVETPPVPRFLQSIAGQPN